MKKIILLISVLIISIFILFFTKTKDSKKYSVQKDLKQVNINIIHFFNRGNFWPDGIQEGIIEDLKKSNHNFNFKSLYLPETSIKQIKEDIIKNRPDIVVLTDSGLIKPFSEFLIREEIPTFVTGITERRSKFIKSLPVGYAKYVSGIIERNQITKSLEIVEKIKNTKITKVALFGGPSIAAKGILDSMSRDMRRERPEIKITLETSGKFEDWKDILVRLNSTNDVMVPLLPFSVTYKGKLLKQKDWRIVGDYMRKHITIPTIGLGDLSDDKIDRLLAFAINPKKMGMQTAIQIFKFIGGESQENLGVEYFRFHDLQIKSRELDRLKLKAPEDLYGFSTFVN